MNIGIKLKELRTTNKISLKELANKIDTTDATICRWENGTSKPDYETIIKYCKFFNISADELLDL